MIGVANHLYCNKLAQSNSNMKKILIALLFPFSVVAQNGKNIELKGKLNLVKPIDWVYISYRNGDEAVQDSVQVKDGSFAFKGKIMEPVLASLRFKHLDISNHARAFIPVFLRAAKLHSLQTIHYPIIK